MSERELLIAALACIYPTNWRGSTCYTDVPAKELTRMQSRRLVIRRRAGAMVDWKSPVYWADRLAAIRKAHNGFR